MFSFRIFGLDIMELNEVSVVLRLLLASLLSGILGYERVRKRRAAGIRTYILVSVGAAIVMMTSQFINIISDVATDPARLGAQVISGIGFIGAGAIIMTGYHRVKGLTTAAGLWSSACLGLAIGSGFYFVALIGTAIIFFTLTVLHKLQDWIQYKVNRVYLYVVFDSPKVISELFKAAEANNAQVFDFETVQEDERYGIGATFSIRYEKHQKRSDIINFVTCIDGINFFEEL